MRVLFLQINGRNLGPHAELKTTNRLVGFPIELEVQLKDEDTNSLISDIEWAVSQSCKTMESIMFNAKDERLIKKRSISDHAPLEFFPTVLFSIPEPDMDCHSLHL